MSLIASFCSINSQYLLFLSILLHAFLLDGASTKKHREIWIKTANTGDLWRGTERSKTQYNIGAGKEIILLIYELNSPTAHVM